MENAAAEQVYYNRLVYQTIIPGVPLQSLILATDTR